jgi:hypothetical protein
MGKLVEIRHFPKTIQPAWFPEIDEILDALSFEGFAGSTVPRFQ